MKILKKIIAPLNIKKGTKGLTPQAKVISILYYPVICLMWWGYYMWKN